MKRFIGFCSNSNFRLLVAGFNKLLEQHKILNQNALLHKNIEDCKNGMMGLCAKTRAKHELRTTGTFFNYLVKWRNLMDIKDRAVKRFVNAALGKGDALKRFGVQKLRVFNLRAKVFQRACKLVTTLGRSANRYTKVHNLFYKMLINAVYKNPWHQKFLDAMVFNSTSEFHISFWKLKRIGEGIGGFMTNKKCHKVGRIASIMQRIQNKEVTRSFWKIERCHEPEDSMTNMSHSNFNTPLLSKNVSRNVSINKNERNSRNVSQNKPKYPPKTPGRSPPKAKNDELNYSAIHLGKE